MILRRSFYNRPVLDVARELLGAVVSANGVAVRISEVEAYDGANNAASHAFRGATPRNGVMFGPAGHAYVYFTYGMHFCMNLVCGPAGVAAAVLLRAGEVVDGIETAGARRSGSRFRDLARGPARLCVALAIDRSFDGVDVTCPTSPITISAGSPVAPSAVAVGPRVGISAAADWPYRFWIEGDTTVSPYRPHTPRKGR